MICKILKLLEYFFQLQIKIKWRMIHPSPWKKNMRKENYTTVTASMLVSLAAYTYTKNPCATNYTSKDNFCIRAQRWNYFEDTLFSMNDSFEG